MAAVPLPELAGDRRNFSTEEIVQLAAQLADGESIECGVKITPLLLLLVHLDNKSEAGVAVSLRVMNAGYMRRDLAFLVNERGLHSIQRAGIGHRPFTVDSYTVKLEDLVHIFDLGPEVVWHLYMHGPASAGMHSRWW